MAFRVIQYAVTLPAGMLRTFLFFTVTLLCASVTQMAHYVYQNLDTVDPRNKNRDINSFSEDECWAFFRFRKEQMHELYHKLGVPAVIICSNGCRCPGEYALCLYLYKSTYPTTFQRIQNTFGLEYSQLSRFNNRMRAFLHQRHAHKVLCNLDWYGDRLDMYADSVNEAIASSPINANAGNVPNALLNIFGFADGCVQPICRPTVQLYSIQPTDITL